MPAVPLVKVKVKVVSVLEGTLKVIGKLMPVPSTLLASPMVTIGTPVASVIVPVPVAVGLLVLPEVTVPVTVKVSSASDRPSTVVGTFTVTVVCPAGMVTVMVVVV